MIDRATKNQEDDVDQGDVLSEAEESALCVIRDIVDQIRMLGMVASANTIERAMIEAGASRAGEAAECEPRRFRFRGTHFSLQAHPELGAGIEINFGAEEL